MGRCMLIVTPLKVVYYFCVLFLLSACASSGTKLETSPKISAQSVGLTKEQSTVLVVQDWWKSLGDAQLNDLVELALKGQPTIAAVKARMNRMLAMADLARASVLPKGNVNATATRQRFTANGIYPLPIAGNTYNMGEVQLGLSWSPDLFGMHAAEWAAAMGQVHAARADTAAAAVSLAAQVSRSYITLGRLLVWRELADQAVLQQDTALQLVRSRAEAGLDTQIDQRQSDALLLDARSQREALDEHPI